MSDRDRSPQQAEFMRPHVKAPNPHPQYLLASALAGLVPAAATVAPQTETVGDGGQVGNATPYARQDHRHPMPGTATRAAAGFMSAADKATLDATGSAIALAQSTASAAQTLAASVQAQETALAARVTALENAAPATISNTVTLTAQLLDLERRFRTLLLAYTNAGMPFPPALAADLVAATNQG